MPRELVGNGGESGPTIKITDKAGAKFVGILKGKVPSRFGQRFLFNIVDTNAPITIKKGESITEVEVAEGDETKCYLLGTTAHDGSGAIQFCTTTERVVCQNTLRAAVGMESLKNLFLSDILRMLG